MNESLKKHIINSLGKGVRPDGRKADEYRKVEVKTGVTKTAEGSAKVKIGDTEVIAGVKLSIDKPYPDTPDQGSLMVGVELLPMSSPEFESGPPSIQSIELARVVDRGIRESKAIDVKKLCIEPGEKIWLVSIDVCIINDAGNLFDACALAAVASLKDTRLPSYDGTELNYKEKTEDTLPIEKLPISITVLKLGNNLIVDPSGEEEKAADARLTVATTPDGELCALQKGGDVPITAEEVEKMVELGSEKGKALAKMI